MSISSDTDYSVKGLRVKTENVLEGGIAPVIASLNYANPRDVKFRVRTVAGTAVAGVDFDPVDREYTIAAGEREIKIPVVSFTNNLRSDDRTLSVAISSLDGADLVAGSMEITIKRPKFERTMANVNLLATGLQHACVTQADGYVHCWGHITYGQNGSGVGLGYAEAVYKMLVPSLPPNPIKLSAAYRFSCALYANGSVYCWGDNSFGQSHPAALSGSPPSSYPVVAASAFLGGADGTAVDVAAGYFNTCIIGADGTVKCKGYNGWGAAGVGNYTTPVTTLTAVAGIGGVNPDAVKLAVMWGTVCAVLDNGAVKCWGQNAMGQVGTGTTGGTFNTAQNNLIISGAIDIAGGYDHACALMLGGGLKCWGKNDVGQLGFNSSGSPVATPTDVTGLPAAVVDIRATANSTCALLVTGEMFCWGSNSLGQVGDATRTNRATPTKVLNLPSNAKKISAGGFFSCAVTGEKNSLQCWGADGLSQTTNSAPYMFRVGDLDLFTAVPVKDVAMNHINSSSGNGSICAVKADGNVFCLGDNTSRQLGINSAATSVTSSSQLNFGADLGVALASGYSFFCALLNTTGVKCWGQNSSGQVGNLGTYTSGTSVDPPQTPNGFGNNLVSGVAKLFAGYSQACAIMTNGTLNCWGLKSSCGTVSAPATITGATNVVDVALGNQHSCYLNQAGVVKCWGVNYSGVFGSGVAIDTCSTIAMAHTAQISGPAIKLSAGAYHTCAVLSGGSVECWGYNFYKQVGAATGAEHKLPVRITDLDGSVAEIVSGANHNCVLTKKGGVKCWGRNSFAGELGVNTDEAFSTHKPQDVLGLTLDVVKLRAGKWTTCAITTGGFLKCWGHTGLMSEIGTDVRLYPVEVRENIIGGGE
jgi:alpha-tubulin suppressor-like RCC1 family protein